MSNQKQFNGINSFLAEQKLVPGEALFTLCTFNSVSDYVHEFTKLASVEDLTETSYKPQGYTALLDAVGSTIEKVGVKLDSLSEDEKPEHVLFLIMTDGHENASKRFNADQIKSMITHQESKYNWKFTFMGANIDAFVEASKLGIPLSNAMNYSSDSDGTRELYSSASRGVSNMRNKVKKENFFDK